jgi:hypothetical protein
MNFSLRACMTCLLPALGFAAALSAQELTWPPRLPDGKTVATATSEMLLKPTETLREGVEIAKTAPTVDFMYYDVQTYAGKPWSVWGDSLAVGDKYYSAIGDHLAPQGCGYVLEYDSTTKKMRKLVDTQSVINLPEGNYTPGKIHSRLDLGSDGWLYFGTHRGSTRVTTDEYQYKGDWILRVHPESGKVEKVVQGPVPKHCIPTSVLDPERMIFYGGTAPGTKDGVNTFFAYDLKNKKVLHTAENGPYRYIIFAKSTGRVYYVAEDEGQLMRYDPSTGKPPEPIPGKIGLRSATQETPDGYVYTVSTRGDGTLYRFNTKTEQIDVLGPAAVGNQTYITSLDVDSTGRYLYYSAGAHGGSELDGTPLVQYDTKTGKKKVICFLFPFTKQFGYTPIGTFGSAISPDGSKLYVTWNGSRAGPDRRGRYDFDTCAMTVIHIPASERP